MKIVEKIISPNDKRIIVMLGIILDAFLKNLRFFFATSINLILCECTKRSSKKIKIVFYFLKKHLRTRSYEECEFSNDRLSSKFWQTYLPPEIFAVLSVDYLSASGNDNYSIRHFSTENLKLLEISKNVKLTVRTRCTNQAPRVWAIKNDKRKIN